MALIYASAVNRRMNETRKKRSVESPFVSGGGCPHQEIIHNKQRSNEEHQHKNSHQHQNHYHRQSSTAYDYGYELSPTRKNSTDYFSDASSNGKRVRSISQVHNRHPSIAAAATLNCSICNGRNSPPRFFVESSNTKGPTPPPASLSSSSKSSSNRRHLQRSETIDDHVRRKVTIAVAPPAPQVIIAQRRKISTPAMTTQSICVAELGQFKRIKGRKALVSGKCSGSTGSSTDDNDDGDKILARQGIRRRSISMDAALGDIGRGGWDAKKNAFQKMRNRFNKWTLQQTKQAK